MWSSVKEVVRPNNLDEARGLIKKDGCVLFSGGTYLVAEKPRHIRCLIDINHLVGSSIFNDSELLRIEAGVTLQTLVNSVDSSVSKELSRAASASCPSKTVRNQRTVGGEIAAGRPDSELLVLLHALDAQIHQVSAGKDSIPLREWEPGGIITDVVVRIKPVERVTHERFALLRSARAFVIVAGVWRNGVLDLATGGRATGIYNNSVKQDMFREEDMAQIAEEAAVIYANDHLGTTGYKQMLVHVGLKRMGMRR